MKDDGILYVAINPQNEDELAIYTINGNTYVSKDESEEEWKKILVEGQVN